MQCEEQATMNVEEADLHQLIEAESAFGLPKDLDDSDDSGVDSDYLTLQSELLHAKISC